MDSKYILSTKTHEDWRNYLLVNSFFFEVLIRHLRSKMGIPEEGLRSGSSLYDWEPEQMAKARKRFLQKPKGGNKSGIRKIKEHLDHEDLITKELYKPVLNILETFHELNLSFNLVRTFMLGHTRISFTGSSKVQIVTSPDNPIRESGVYIKFTPDLTDKEILMLKKQALSGYKTLSHIKDFKVSTHAKKRKSPSKENLRAFLSVESFLLNNYLHKHHAFVIDTIFEQVARELKSKPGTVRRKYYNIIKNFQLPSTPELNKIPRD